MSQVVLVMILQTLSGVLFFEDGDPLVGTDPGQVVDENA
jgi:hypothetical protein